jgi:hypothetical protein
MRIFETEFESLYKELKFPHLKIDDYSLIDN